MFVISCNMKTLLHVNITREIRLHDTVAMAKWPFVNTEVDRVIDQTRYLVYPSPKVNPPLKRGGYYCSYEEGSEDCIVGVKFCRFPCLT